MTELKNQRKTLQMRGFRKGEAPLSLLRKIIGAEKLVRILDETLNTTIANYMKEHQRNYVGNPISLSINPPIDPRVDQDYVFEVLLGEHGKIVNRLDYNNKIFTRYNIEVEEKGNKVYKVNFEFT
jgi:trigger factor